MKKNYNRNWLFYLKTMAVFGSMLCAGAVSAQLSGTYTINSGAATSGTNYASFTAFATAINGVGVSGPVTVNVVSGSGPYSGQVQFTASGTATNTITINGNGNTLKNTSSASVVNLNGADYVTIDNLIIDAAGTGNGTRGVWFHNGADNNTISNCQIIFSAYSGTNNSTAYISFSGSATSSTSSGNHGKLNLITGNVMKGSSNSYGPYYGFADYRTAAQAGSTVANVFTDNDVRDVYYYSVYMYRTNGMTIENNKFHTSRSGTGSRYGFYAYYCVTTTHQISISNNEVTNLSGNYVYLSYLYYTTGTAALPFKYNNNKFNYNNADYYLYGNRLFYADYSEVNNNEMAYNTADYYIYYAFLNYYNDNSEMVNNIYHNNYGGYGEMYSLYVGYANDTKVAHNTIALGDISGGYYYYSWYTLSSAAYSNFEFKNNILTCYTTPGYGYAYPARLAENVDYAGNVVDLGTGTYTKYLYAGTSVSGTLAAWIAALDDGAVIAADPQYTNLSAGDLKPKNPKIANIGATGMVALDYAGVSRTACGPDPGAFEFYVDHSASNPTTLPSTECGNYTTEISVDFNNGTNVAMTDVPMFYSINGNRVDETIDNVSASTSVTYTFDAKAVFNTPGVNTVVIGLGCDDDASNNITTQTITITPSPYGSDLTMGTQFDGYFNDGNMGNPDVTVNGYGSDYDVTDPAMATNVTYSLKVMDEAMTDVTSSGFALSSTTLGAVISADPATSLTGKRVFLEMTTLDNTTGCDTTFGRYMYIPHTPVADFLASNICLGDVAQFKNKSTLAASSYSPNYITTKWEFNDPDTSITDDNSDILDGFWEYSTYSAGVNVEMTVVNGLYPKFEYSLTKTINVTPKPEVDFKVLNACEGDNITIVNNTSISTGGAITYAWDFGGVYTSTSANPAYTFATPGQRKVKVVATSNGCKAELTKNAYQFEKPVADFVSEGKCNFVDVLFNSTSSIPNNGNMGYKWDFASEGISRSQSPAFAFATAGSKTVKLTATSEFGCESVITKTIVLDESPVADFTWDAACNLTPINFTRTGSVPNGGINSSMTWDFNGEGTSTGTNDAKHQFPKVGSKLVTLTIADGNGCSNSITKEVNVVLQAVANFDVASVCQGDETQFTGKSSVAAGNLTYNWTFGDGTPASGDHSPKHTYGTSGSYNVTLEAIVAGGCSDVISKAVFVNPAPDATWTFTKAGRNVVLNSTADNNDAYKWTFGDGSRATDANPTYNYDNVDLGTFTICLATRKGICWSEDCKDITVDLAGIADLTESNDMINVYPNPTSGKFTVSVENAGKDAVVKVGDILGNVISARVIDNLNGTYSVDMSAVADGVYFVQVKNGDYFATKRITVSK